MYKSGLRLAALIGLLGTGLWADSTSVDGGSSMFGLWFGRGSFGFYVTPPSPTPAATPTPDPTPTIVSVAPIVTNTPPAPSGNTSTVTVGGSYDSTLYGSGLTYTSSVYGTSLTGNPVTLNSTSPFAYDGYLSSLPTGATLTDATLNLSLLIGAATGSVLSGPGTPNFAGSLGQMTVTITAGGVTQTVTGTSLSAYDLFSNGFGSAILAGVPLTLSFTALDTLSGTVSATTPAGMSALSFGRGSFFFASTPTTTTVMADTRTLSASDLSNYLTLVYTSANNTNPVVVPFAGPVDPVVDLDDAPEPMSMSLVGFGLGMLVYWRRKQSR